jgi:drug/metabolite transporter (DMT)-like permease
MLVPVEGIGELNPIGVLLVLGAEISWAIGSIYGRGVKTPTNPALWSGMTMVCGGLALLAAGTLLGEAGQVDPSAFSTRSLIAFGYLVLFGSIAAFTAYTWLLANVPVSIVATYAYVNPIVAVALGALILSEPITPRTLIASVIIIGAVFAMISGRPRETEEPAPRPDAAALEAE